MVLAVNGWAVAAIAAVVLMGTLGAVRAALRRRAAKLAVWKKLRNGMTPDEVRALLGEPCKTLELEDGQKWDYSPTPNQASVLFTYGKVSGYVKPF